MITKISAISLPLKSWEKKYTKTDEIKKTLDFDYLTYTLPNGAYPKKNYFIDGKIYSYMSDKKVYLLSEGAFTLSDSRTFSVEPKLVKIMYGGESSVLACTPATAVILGNLDADISAIDADGLCVYRGMLFTFKGRVLRFSKSFDYTYFSVGIDLGGYYMTEDTDGDICAFKVIGDNLYLLCEHSLIKITATFLKTEFKAERINAPYFSAVKNSVAFIGDTAVFISGKKLCSFKGGKLSFYKTSLFGDDFDITDRACVYGDVYVLPVEINSENKYFCYSTYDDEEYYLSGKSALSSEGGICFDTEKNKTAVMSDKLLATVSGGFEETFDFDKSEKKSVRSVSVIATGTADLVVYGDFGEKTLNIKRRYSEFKVLLCSNAFSIRIESPSNDFFIEKIKFKYSVYGD